jgi:la-related protein 6
MESFLQRSLSTALASHDSDSDAGYGTPAETFFAVEKSLKKEKKLTAEDLSSKDDGEMVVDSDLQEKIIKQVEWYFSDDNLLKDSFLMKHINRNKQGYISLKLVASLRKVKTLSKDWTVVLESLKHSSLLALNEEETKIRRKSPAPQVDFGHIAKTLLITEYPQQQPNLADLEQHFGRYGEVSRVRLIHPGRAIPLDVKPCKAQYPSLGKDLCVLVEFGSEEVAKLALLRIRKQQSWRDEMKVHLLGEKKSSPTAQETKDQEERCSYEGKRKTKWRESKAQDAQSQSTRQRGNHYHKDGAPHRLRDLSRYSREVSPAAYKPVSPPSGSSSPDTAYRRRNKNSPELSRKYLKPEAWKDYSSDSGMSCGSRSSSESPKITPEPPRKFFSNGFDKHHANSCVIRQPLGPDGTRGFIGHRASPISIAVQSC